MKNPALSMLLIFMVLMLSACGGGGGSIISSNPLSASASGGTTTSPPTSVQSSVTLPASLSGSALNTLALTIDGGVASLRPSNPYINGVFTTITLCVPNTSQCQNIDHVLVDTGSVGLRLLAQSAGGEFYLPLPSVTDAGTGSAVYECTQFADGYTWGSMNKAQINLSGETPVTVPVQVIGANSAPPVPASCIQNATVQNAENTLSTLASNGIIGIGAFTQDCGLSCLPQPYYFCSNSVCSYPSTPPALAEQAVNPISALKQDNNGSILVLPSIGSTGASSVAGQMILGINTQANNMIPGTAPQLILDNNGQLGRATWSSSTLNSFSTSYFDSGTSVLEIGSSLIPACSSGNGFDCPATLLQGTTQVFDTLGSRSQFTLGIANADQLFSSFPNNYAFSDLGAAAPNDQTLVLGLPFFYGREVALTISTAQQNAEISYWNVP